LSFFSLPFSSLSNSLHHPCLHILLSLFLL
jgi:hypothetical protein